MMRLSTLQDTLIDACIAVAAMTVDMSISLELVETFSLSPLERAVNLNLWQNHDFCTGPRISAFCANDAIEYSVFGVFLTMVP